MSETSAQWLGVQDRVLVNDGLVQASDHLADAAKAGAWDDVFAVLAGSRWDVVNLWRIGGRSLYAPLHQAAWHGADVAVVERLLELGAWRSLRDADGRRPLDIARERGHEHLLGVLATSDPTPRTLQRYAALDRRLDELIRERTRTLEPVSYRSIPSEVVETERLDPLWFGYPGMYGGFAVSPLKGRIFVESWSRVAGGSGQAHVITDNACTLVDEGFV